MEILSWFVVEALVATALLVLIVWWTWPRAAKEDADAQQDKPKN